MSTLYVTDVTGLLTLSSCVRLDQMGTLWRELTIRVENKDFGFPKEVVDDLDVLARSEPVLGWAHGVSGSLGFCATNIKHERWVMNQVQQVLGFDLGFETVDGRDPSVGAVAMLARDLSIRKANFVVVTEDVLANPLRPSMLEICDSAAWPRCDTRSVLEQFGLSDLLVT